MRKIINGLPQNKSVSGDVSVNILRSSELIFSYLTECINEVLPNSEFPESLKLSDIVPVFDQLAFYLLFQRFLKKLYLINYATI